MQPTRTNKPNVGISPKESAKKGLTRMKSKQIQATGLRASNLTLSIDDRSAEVMRQIKDQLGEELGAYPSSSVLARRAIQFYVDYLKRIMARKQPIDKLRDLQKEHLELLKAARSVV